jgi:ferredoxin
MSTQFKICNCNRTMPLNTAAGEKLGDALGTGAIPVATELCRREVGQYLDGIQGADRVVVGCTQERALFSELAQQRQSAAPVRFVNIRETANWGKQARQALAKTAAMLADAALPGPDPVPTVNYISHGDTLIIGSAEHALPWAEQLRAQLNVSVLLTDGAANHPLPEEREFPIFSGDAVKISGWLGAFNVMWQQRNPIDLDVCVRCNACVEACPENAINSLYQVEADKCRSHGDCVKACGPVGAIDFSRGATQRHGRFDLVFDLSSTSVIARHQPPQGYFAAGHDKAAQLAAALQLTQMLGEFEKPKYFNYKEKLCAHSRNRKSGCNACIDVCSAKAIESNGDRIKVNPHLCAGCGACTTVCPSGALGYAYPGAPHMGRRLKTLLTTYANAGGTEAVFLLHGEKQGRAMITRLGRMAKTSKLHQGMPARVIPVEVHHTASVGIDLWLAAIAYGATGIAVLTTGEEAPQYVDALKDQMAIAQTALSGLGYAGSHLQLIQAATPDELDVALRDAPQGEIPEKPATFHVAADKRNTLDFALDHLYRHAPLKKDHIALPAGAPFGSVQVNASACTLCMSCVGACPESALMDSMNKPQLRFVEKNCVQCGLCAQTCPEDAVTLVPRLSFTEASRNAVVLNEAQPFCCIRCNKPFGTLQMIEAMVAKLAHHGAFSANIDRIKMCADCRVVDMMENKREASIVEPGRWR